MLTFEEYNSATLDTKYEEVFSKGELLDTFYSENYKVALYVYNKYIVEVLYRLEINTVKDLLAVSFEETAEKYVSLKGRLNFS